MSCLIATSRVGGQLKRAVEPDPDQPYFNRSRGRIALDESEEIKRRIAQLEVEHRDLDAAIAALAAQSGHDQLLTARLKKRKLLLRDEIAELIDQTVPDIIA